MNGFQGPSGLDLDEQLHEFLQGPLGLILMNEDERIFKGLLGLILMNSYVDFFKDLTKNEESFLDPWGFLGIWEVGCLKALEFQSLKDLVYSLPIWE
ncbi:hypothetical protein ACFX2I_029397 [Malus domestica]